LLRKLPATVHSVCVQVEKKAKYLEDVLQGMLTKLEVDREDNNVFGCIWKMSYKGC